MFELAREARVAAEVVDGAVFCGGHEPGAGVVGDAGLGPLLERGDEGVLSEVFGAGDVADEAGQAGDEARGFDSPDGVDGAMGVGGSHSPDHSIFVPLVQVWVGAAFRSSRKKKRERRRRCAAVCG